MIDPRQFKVRIVTTHKAGAQREQWYHFGSNAIAAETYAANYDSRDARDSRAELWFGDKRWMSAGHESRFRHPEDCYV